MRTATRTALHLAVAARAPAVAEALMSKGKVRADVMKKDGKRPLDLAAKSTSFFSMVSLVATLAAFGAQPRPQRREHVQQWNHHDMTKVIEKTSDSLAVIAVLVAGIAFTAANNIPGSYEQAEGNTKGMAVLDKKPVFKCFLILDSSALVTSVLVVVLLVYGKASRSAGSWKTFTAALHCLWLSLISMVLAFYAALEAVTSTRAVDISFTSVRALDISRSSRLLPSDITTGGSSLRRRRCRGHLLDLIDGGTPAEQKRGRADRANELATSSTNPVVVVTFLSSYLWALGAPVFSGRKMGCRSKLGHMAVDAGTSTKLSMVSHIF
ncbi:ankyrin repeat-containing protein [Hordeum vulgare]|nr:ankyrin repeat-containing protein [Hordeum vulgare]